MAWLPPVQRFSAARPSLRLRTYDAAGSFLGLVIMQTAEQFMRDFLSESEALHRKYHDDVPLPQEVESVSTLGSFAVVIIKVPGLNMRMRYRLRPAHDSWMIEHKDIPCAACRGFGKKRGTEEICPKCEGTCWIGFK